MAKNSVSGVKENPKLCQKTLSDGRISLYLDYYRGYEKVPKLDEFGNQLYYPEGTEKAGQPVFAIQHTREKRYLKLYILAKPKTPEERERNKETLLLAQKIRFEESQKLLEDAEGYRLKAAKNSDFIAFAERFVEEYQKADMRVTKSALLQFKSYLREKHPSMAQKRTPAEVSAIQSKWADRHEGINGRHDLNENDLYRFSLKANGLTPEMVAGFVAFLLERLNGESPNNYYTKFRRIVAEATKKGIIKNNPCKGIKCKWDDDGTIKKDFLTADEVKRLISHHYEGENPEIRRAFTLTMLTGLRWCDVRRLTYSNVDYTKQELSVKQAKTGVTVRVPLREDVIKLIGTPEESGKAPGDKVFNLPSSTMANKALGHWAKRAGIEKHLTWHCGRHTFATLVLDGGANLQVTRELLGHSSFNYLRRYVHALDESKKAAVEALPSISL